MVPNNVLIVGAPHTGKISICQHITKDSDATTISTDTHSGVTYNHQLSTKYYTIELNLLVEEFPESRDVQLDETDRVNELKKWCEEFKKGEFRELRDVLDGLVFTFCIDADSVEYVEKCLEVVDEIRGLLSEEAQDDWPGFIVIAGIERTRADQIDKSRAEQIDKSGADQTDNAIAAKLEHLASDSAAKIEQLEDAAIALGFEFLNFSQHGKNEYSEKLGRDRLLEIFESHEWSHMDTSVSSENYKQNKYSKVDSMTKGLLEVSDDELEEHDNDTAQQADPDAKSAGTHMELDQLFQKLQLARENVNNMKQSQKEEYVNKVIEDVINYI